MASIYDKRLKSTILFGSVSLIFVVSFLYFSHKLVRELSEEEHSKVEIWAESMRILSSESGQEEIPLILKVLQSNRTIPVILVDDHNKVLTFKNIEITSRDSSRFLEKAVERFKQKDNKIIITLGDSSYQYLYYDDSILLKKLSYYPYIQLAVMFVFLIVVFFAIRGAKRAEQNQVWVGLSKETAHQLGTPISSLLAWVEFLRMKNVDPFLLTEMNKDVERLRVIAERFSKIGSKPDIYPIDIIPTIKQAVNYISKRTSTKVIFDIDMPEREVQVALCVPLFEWVIENLCKNAIDAMDGIGRISLSLFTDHKFVYIEILDTGKGIPKSKFNTIFLPGYTTKSRGWGLGLTLVKRIIEEYLGGKIFVKSSELNVGTIFRIELQMIN